MHRKATRINMPCPAHTQNAPTWVHIGYLPYPINPMRQQQTPIAPNVNSILEKISLISLLFSGAGCGAGLELGRELRTNLILLALKQHDAFNCIAQFIDGLGVSTLHLEILAPPFVSIRPKALGISLGYEQRFIANWIDLHWWCS